MTVMIYNPAQSYGWSSNRVALPCLSAPVSR